jgi:hypothetical protein
MLHTIIADGRTVATTDDSTVVDRLNSDSILRQTVRCIKTTSGRNLWNGVSQFTSRPATETEQAAFHQWQTAGRAC